MEKVINGNTCEINYDNDSGLYQILFDPQENGPKQLNNSILKAMIDQNQFEFFYYNKELATVNPGEGPKIFTTSDLLAYLIRIAEINQPVFKVIQKRPFKNRELIAVLKSPYLKSIFPQLKLYTRSPLFDTDWSFYSKQGFRASSGIYYDGPVIEPRQTTEYIDKVLGGFHFKSEVDRINFLGMVLTGLTMPNWIGKHGLLLINGNQPGVGKSLLAKVLGLIVERKIPAMMRFEKWESELDRQICGRLRTGQRTIILDNAKGYSASSEVLESLITSEVMSFRPLGRTEPYERENDVIFCITANGLRLSDDLRRRCVPVELEYQGNVHQVKYPIPDLENYIRNYHKEIVGELAGMVIKWIEQGKPIPSDHAKHSVGPEWAQTIDGILRVNGHEGFLTNMDTALGNIDLDYKKIKEMCELFHDEEPMTSKEWVERFRERDVFHEYLVYENGDPKAPHSIETTIGALFNRYVNRIIEIDEGKFRLIKHGNPNSHQPKKYSFEAVLENDQEAHTNENQNKLEPLSA